MRAEESSHKTAAKNSTGTASQDMLGYLQRFEPAPERIPHEADRQVRAAHMEQPAKSAKRAQASLEHALLLVVGEPLPPLIESPDPAPFGRAQHRRIDDRRFVIVMPPEVV